MNRYKDVLSLIQESKKEHEEVEDLVTIPSLLNRDMRNSPQS